MQDLSKSQRCGFVGVATEGKCNKSHFIIIIANKAAKQNIRFAFSIRLEYFVCYQVATVPHHYRKILLKFYLHGDKSYKEYN